MATRWLLDATRWQQLQDGYKMPQVTSIMAGTLTVHGDLF